MSVADATFAPTELRSVDATEGIGEVTTAKDANDAKTEFNPWTL